MQSHISVYKWQQILSLPLMVLEPNDGSKVTNCTAKMVPRSYGLMAIKDGLKMAIVIATVTCPQSCMTGKLHSTKVASCTGTEIYLQSHYHVDIKHGSTMGFGIVTVTNLLSSDLMVM